MDRTTSLPALLFAVVLAMASATPAHTREVCTIVADQAAVRIILERGDCRTRVTPASAFKVTLAAMGFAEGLVVSPDRPVHEPRAGDPDWGGAAWRRAASPSDWMEHSIVWYSRRLTHAMGQSTLRRYAERFGYGNANFAGDPSYNNGLDRAWIMSSLRISPAEQVAFLGNLRAGRLDLPDGAVRGTLALMPTTPSRGWILRGKTGTAYPRRADRSFDYERGYGWYVGWAEDGDRTLVFVRLNQDTGGRDGSPGNRARDGFAREWPSIAKELRR